jgi:hypothetical protein
VGGAGGAGLSITNPGAGGGGGGGGHVGGGGGGGGGNNSAAGGGGGGQSYASSAVTNVVYHDGVAASALVIISAVVADPPLAPSAYQPTPGSYIDAAAAGVTFNWVYNPDTNSGNQNAYALQISQDGGAYQWWNASTAALVGSVVWNTQTAFSIAIPASKLADGHTYTWALATQEANSNLQGPYSTPQVFFASPMPTVTIISPPSTTSESTVTVIWSETLGASDVQISFRVVIYAYATTLAAGFAPGAATALIDSGVVSSAATSWTAPSVLAAGTYSVYVQITETGPIASLWAQQIFAVVLAGPIPPVLTLVGSTDVTTLTPIVQATIDATNAFGSINLLTAADSSLDTGIGTWTAGANTTVAQSTAQAEYGADSLSLTATAGGSVTAHTATGASAYTVQPGLAYAAMASFVAGATSRSCTVGINWYTSAGALISTSTGSGTFDVTGAWVEATVTDTAPTTAAYAGIVVTIAGLSASEVHYVDQIGLARLYGTSFPPWTYGGTTFNTALASLMRSTTGGSTWVPVRNATNVVMSAVTITFLDYEVPFGTIVEYQAIIGATSMPTNQPVVSTPAYASIVVPSARWWLTDPLDSTVACEFGSYSADSSISLEIDTAEEAGIFYGWQNPTAIIQRGIITYPSFTINAVINGYANWHNLRNLLGLEPKNDGTIRQSILLLRGDMGQQYYVYIGPAIQDQVMRAGDRPQNPWRWVVLPCTVTAAP